MGPLAWDGAFLLEFLHSLESRWRSRQSGALATASVQKLCADTL